MRPRILITLPHDTLLRAEGHRVRLLGLVDSLSPEFNLAFVLPRSCPQDERHVLGDVPIYEFEEPRLLGLAIPYLSGFSKSFRKACEHAAEDFRPHLFLSDLPWGAEWLGKRFREPVIHFSHGVEQDFSEITLRHLRLNFFPFTSIGRRLTGAIEKAACVQSDLTITMSVPDAERFQELYWLPHARLLPLAQPVHFGPVFQRPDDALRRNLRRSFGIEDGRFICVFLGSGHHLPNRLAADAIRYEVAPRLSRQHAEILFLIAGTGMEAFSDGAVRSLGFVENIQSLLQMSDVALLPILHGAGVRMKTFDFISAGVPIVATKKAVEGTELVDNRDILVSDDSIEDFIERLSGLLEIESHVRESALSPVARSAWKTAKAAHDADLIGEQLRHQLLHRFLPEYLDSTRYALANS